MKTLDTRYSPSLFSLFDYERVERHLEKMAAKGWQLEETGSFLWKFRKDAPKKKQYAVVFSKDTSDYDPYPTEGQTWLKNMCEEDGWTKEAEWKQMQIFSCTDMDAELVTDEHVRLNSIRRAMKKTYIPCWTITLLGLLLFSFQNITKLSYGNTNDEYGTLWVVIIAMYGVFMSATILVSYFIWTVLSERAIEEGRTCISTKWSTVFQYTLCIGLFVLAGCYILGKSNLPILVTAIHIIMYLLVMVATVFLTSVFTDYLRRKGIAKSVNIICSAGGFIILVALGIILVNLIGITK